MDVFDLECHVYRKGDEYKEHIAVPFSQSSLMSILIIGVCACMVAITFLANAAFWIYDRLF